MKSSKFHFLLRRNFFNQNNFQCTFFTLWISLLLLQFQYFCYCSLQNQSSYPTILVRRSITRLTRDDNSDNGMSSTLWNQPKIEMPVVPPFVKILRKEYKEREPSLPSHSSTTSESPLEIVEIYDDEVEEDETGVNSTIIHEKDFDTNITFPNPNGSETLPIGDDYEIPYEGDVSDSSSEDNDEDDTTNQNNDSSQSRSPKLIIVMPNEGNDTKSDGELLKEANHKNDEMPQEVLQDSVISSSTPNDAIEISVGRIDNSGNFNNIPPNQFSKPEEINPMIDNNEFVPRTKPTESIASDSSSSQNKSNGSVGLFQAILRMAQEKTKIISSTFTQLASVLLKSPSSTSTNQRRINNKNVYE